MPRVNGFNHITINVHNLEQSLEFYRDLGVELVHKGNCDAYLEWGNAWICLQERTEYIQTLKEKIGVDHVAFSVDEKDFDDAVQDLKNLIEKGPIKRGLGQSIYFRDPDGNLLEFHTSNLKERMSMWK